MAETVGMSPSAGRVAPKAVAAAEVENCQADAGNLKVLQSRMKRHIGLSVPRKTSREKAPR
jgi:hypothetical protein